MSAARKLKRNAMKKYLRTPEDTILAMQKGFITEAECDKFLKNRFNRRRLTEQESKDKDFLEGIKEPTKKPLTAEELGEKLCEYCPLEDVEKGTHNFGNGPVMCEGCSCTEAYEFYLEEFEEEKQDE